MKWNGFADILGINRRNLEFVFAENPRKHFPTVDDKVLTKEILAAHGLPHIPLIAHVTDTLQLARLPEVLRPLENFALKPANGYGGIGIQVMDHREGDGWASVSGKHWPLEELVRHAREILFGVYSIDNAGDTVIIEEKIHRNDFLVTICDMGIPDIRVITLRGEPAMAMLRLPTRESDGKANLHQGGVGLAIDLDTGITGHAISRHGAPTHHPDTGTPLQGLQVPSWEIIMNASRKAAEVFPLGYLGLDWILDVGDVPRILELNARPGLEIQNANMAGLRPRLAKILAASKGAA